MLRLLKLSLGKGNTKSCAHTKAALCDPGRPAGGEPRGSGSCCCDGRFPSSDKRWQCLHTGRRGKRGEEKTCNYACAVTSEGGRWGGGEGLGGTAERAFSAQPGFVSLARTKNIHHLVLNASVEYLRLFALGESILMFSTL